MIRAKKVMLVFDSITMKAIDPEYLGTTKEEMVDYMQVKPMPKDEKYSGEDFIDDITQSSGFYSLPDGIKEETIEYVVDALNYFV